MIQCNTVYDVQYSLQYNTMRNTTPQKIYKNLTLSNNNKMFVQLAAFWAMNHKTCHYIIIHTPALLYGNHSRVIIYS